MPVRRSLPGTSMSAHVASLYDPSGFMVTEAKAGPLSVVATRLKPPGTAVMFSKWVMTPGSLKPV